MCKVWPNAKTVEEVQDAFPDRSYAAIQLKAASLGLKAFNRSRRGDLSRLLNGQLTSWYWLGFFLADGYISKGGEFSITLSARDEDHLNKLANYLSAKTRRLRQSITENGSTRNHVRLNLMNPDVANKINDLFGIMGPKTTNPPSVEKLKKMEREEMAAVVAGFFDGDGTARSKGYGQITCHEAWLPVFEQWSDLGLVSNPRLVSGRAMCTLSVAQMRELGEMPLPFLERKWKYRKVS